MNVLEVRSKKDLHIHYLFESEHPPRTKKNLNEGSTIEQTLELGTPMLFEMAREDLDKIINDCAHAELQEAYRQSYAFLEGLLKKEGINATSYRVHKVRNKKLLA